MIGQLGIDLTAALAFTHDLPVSSETWVVAVFRGFMPRPH